MLSIEGHLTFYRKHLSYFSEFQNSLKNIGNSDKKEELEQTICNVFFLLNLVFN